MLFPIQLLTIEEGFQCCLLKKCVYCYLKVLCPRKAPVVQIFNLVYPNEPVLCSVGFLQNV